jgi:hypothetical protein
MFKLASLVRWLLLAILVPLAIPVATVSSTRWAESRGWYSPGEPGGWLTTLVAIGELPWLLPVVLVVAGLTAGAWLDWLIRKLDHTRAAERVEIGNELLHLANRVASRQEGIRNEWPANVHDLRPSIMSAFIKVERIGVWAPVDQPYGRLDGANILVNYLQLVGTMLSEGHFKQARKRAAQVRAFLETGSNS